MEPETKPNEEEKISIGNGAVALEKHDDLCVNAITEAVGNTPGIVGVKLDTTQQELSIDYDPGRIAESQLEQLVRRFSPTIRQNMATCTMRLPRRGGRLCESCAAMLEGRVSQIQGVRNAAASYTGGVLSVTYDNNLLSPDQLIQSIRQFGVSVAPSYAELPAIAAANIIRQSFRVPRLRGAIKGLLGPPRWWNRQKPGYGKPEPGSPRSA